MADNTVTSCLNGELKPGDLVLSTPVCDYACLVGTVLSIDKAGSPDHDTDNPGDDIHVNFRDMEYSEKRLLEVTEMLGDLYGCPTPPGTFPPIDIDDVIMAPDMLFRITGFTPDLMRVVLGSREGAELLCKTAEHLYLPPVEKEAAAPTEYVTQKLYSPLYAVVVDKDNDEYDGDYWNDPISQYTATDHEAAIHDAILRERVPGEGPRGLMEYYHGNDSVESKVRSLYVDVEVHDQRLWGVATLKLSEPLSHQELAVLKEYISGQYSDGFGEGFEQHEIKVDEGELYVSLWSSEHGFFIDTRQEFEERLGIRLNEPEEAQFTTSESVSAAETPAQAALHEPDIFDDGATASLRDQLIERLNGNFKEYMSGAARNSEWDVTDMSSEIAAYAGAHYHLTELHNFHTSELEYLLLFKNPLQVVADAFIDAGPDRNSDIMWQIFDRQEALHRDYERMNKPPLAVFSGADLRGAPPVAPDMALVRLLWDKVNANFAAFETDLLTSKRDVISIADKIAAMENARYYLTEFAHEFSPETIDGLLKLDNPLKVVAYAWEKHTSDLSDMTGIIREVALKADIAKLGKDPDHADSRVMRSFYPDEKPSVLEQLRQAAKEPKPPRREPPQRDHNGPEH